MDLAAIAFVKPTVVPRLGRKWAATPMPEDSAIALFPDIIQLFQVEHKIDEDVHEERQKL